jgi:sugar lactone lactonase YvrE
MRLSKPALILIVGLTIVLATVARITSAYLLDTEASTANSLTAWVEQSTDKFYVTQDDNYGYDDVYKYDSSGSYLEDFSLNSSNRRSAGVARVGSDLYILDRDDSQVYHYTTAGQYLEVSRRLRTTTGGSLNYPNGLAIDGDEMWVTEETGSIYRYSLSAAFPYSYQDLSASSSISLDYWTGNRKAHGLAIDSNYLYVADQYSNRIFRYARSNGAMSYSKILRQVDGSSLYYPSGCMYDGTSLWVSDNGWDEVYEYDLSDLFSSGSTVNAIYEFACTSGNSQSEGI